MAAVAAATLLAVPTWSFVHAVTRANGDPFSVKATEWARDHDLSWLVNRVENFWYSHHQPPVGGLPRGGIPQVPAVAPKRVHRATLARAHRHVLAPCPARVQALATPALPNEGLFAVAGRPSGAVCFAYLRPDPVHTSVVVGVAWMNMHLLTATLHNGTSLPGGGPWLAGPMISPAEYPSVAAAFNGGFRLDASRGGYYTEGRTVKPLVPGRASLVIEANGRVDIGMWGRDDAAGPNTISVLQNLDLLVDHGQVSAGAFAGSTSDWGATLGNHIFTWRSGVGIDSRGNLIYVAGPGLDVPSLAGVLQRAGAVRAMELDINPSWTSLMVYDSGPSGTVLPTKLLAGMRRPADRYLRPGTRAFIELDLRH